MGADVVDLGCRFAEIEAIVVLVLFVTRYKIEVKPEVKYMHETFEERRERILKTTDGLTLTCVLIICYVPLMALIR